MESLKPFSERLLPDLAIASAAMGVFFFLGMVVFISILFENWQNARKNRRKSARLENMLPKSALKQPQGSGLTPGVLQLPA